MHTGYANVLTPAERLKILDMMPATANGRRFLAGAFVEGETGDMASLCTRQTDAIQQRDGTPISFQSTALTSLPNNELIERKRKC